MTKTDWTAEEVRATVKKIKGHAMTVEERADMFDIADAFAERIEADESAVPYGWVNLLGEVRPVRRGEGDIPVFTHPPAQPSQVDKCCCGEPSVLGVRHRSDGPCHLSEKDADAPPAQPAQEQPGWKVPEALLTWANAEDGGDSMYDAARRHVREMLTIKPEPSPTAPKEK